MKRLLLILTLVCFANIVWAKQVTRDQALRQAQMFLSQKGLPGSLTSAETQMARRRAQGTTQPDCYYVFNAGMDQGFVIVSGDDRVETVLGYSTSGHFDVDNIPPAMADLLNHYAAQIEAIRNGAPVAARRASHNYLPDLMTVKWAQGEPYNNKTPLGYPYYNSDKSESCVTGCVATAMAQVLYHQHFVDATQATIPGYQNKIFWEPPSGKKTAYLAEIPSGSALEWNKMVDNYKTQTTTQEQKDAVANLMLYCGTAVKMKYSISGSSAPVSAIPDAFKSYFGYSRGTRYVSRSVYSDSEWDDLIYNEIYLGRPVIYGGQTANDEGHAFIVHGYDGDGRYSINWGWGGFQDNYFYLSDLTPSQGTGGENGGYNYNQDAVIYLAKEDGSFSETVKAIVMDTKIGDFQRYTDGSLVVPTQTEYAADKDLWGRVRFSLAISFTSRLANTYIMDFGYGILNSNGQLVGDVQKLNTAEIKDGLLLTYGIGTSGFGGNLSTGNYYIKAYSKESTSSDWLLCDDADKYAVSLTVTDTKMSFEVVDISIITPDPEQEVTDADREELITTYTTLKTFVEAKQTAVADNEKKIAELKAAINTAFESAKTVSDKIAEIKTLLEDKYISESQKKENLLKLVMIYEKELEDYQESLEIVSSKLGDAEKSNASFATKLEEVNKAIADLIVKVDVATKKDDVEALKPEAEVIMNHLQGVDITSISKDLDALAEQLKTLSLSDTSTALAELQKVIQDLIDTAKSDEEKEKQEAEKLAKAKEDCQSAIQTLEGTIESQEADYEKCLNVLNVLKAKLSEIDNAISQMKVEYTEIEKKLQELIDMQSDTRADNSEIIENLKKKLETLNSNIIILESQRDLISGQIEQLEDVMQIYDSLIKKAIDIRNQLPTLLASATAIDDVESMTRLATLASNELSSNGVDVFNQYVGIYNVVRDNMSILIDNVNIVYNQANSLQSEVENELTAINQLIIDETEVVARYDMKGNRVDSTYKGVQIIRLKNGKIIKLNVK